MKRELFAALLLTMSFSSLATEPKDLAPSQRDLDRSADRAEQERGQRQFERQRERERVRSEAERRIDKIPNETRVRPIYRDRGGGVEVTIPNK